MSTNIISGANFKQMLEKAGHTHGYLSEKVKKELRETTLRTGGHASKILHADNARIDKHDAVNIIKRLKAQHLAHGVTTSAEKFVSTAIHHQQAVEKSITRQRKDDRVKDLANKAHDQSAKPGHSTPPKAVSLAAHSVAAVQHQPAATSTAVHHVTTPFKHLSGHTAEAGPTNTTISPGGAIHNPKPSEEAIDLAID